MKHAPTTNYYRTPTGALETLPKRIDAAYAAADRKPPRRTYDLEQALKAEPTADELAQALAVESLAATDADAFLADAIERIKRAHAVDSLRSGIARHRVKAIKTNADDIVAEAAADLTAPFNKAAKQLATAAKKLTNVERPFDLERIIADDATAEMKAAGEALALMGQIAVIHGGLGSTRHQLDPGVAGVLPVVALDDCDIEEVNRMTGTAHPGQDDPARDAMRGFSRLVWDHGADAALVAVARGDFSDHVRLELAPTTEELIARRGRAERAVSRIKADGPGPKVALL